MNNSIKIAKLVSSEFIIGRVVENILTNILLIKFNVNSITGEVTKILAPYMAPLTTSIGHIISLDKTIVIESAPEELIIQYVNFLKNILAVQEKKLETNRDSLEQKDQNVEPNGVHKDDKI